MENGEIKFKKKQEHDIIFHTLQPRFCSYENVLSIPHNSAFSSNKLNFTHYRSYTNMIVEYVKYVLFLLLLISILHLIFLFYVAL